MSYYNRFATSLALLKIKQNSNNGNASGTNKPSLALLSNNHESTATSSKSKITKIPSGLAKAPIKSKSKSPGPSSFRKPATSNPPISSSSRTPSDDFTGALVLKRKPPSKAPIVYLSKEASNKNAIKKRSNSPNPASKPVVKEKVAHEGPVEFPDENFDFYKILARPKGWLEEENAGCKLSPSGTGAVVEVKSSPSYVVNGRESEIWGSMRSSTGVLSTTPSLTSMLDGWKDSIETRKESNQSECIALEKEREKMECSELDIESGQNEGIQLEEVGEEKKDANNNVLSNIRNSLFGFALFRAAQPNDDNGNGEADKSAASELEREAVLSREQGQLNGSEGKINVQSSHNNINNSRSVTGFPDRCEIPSSFQEAALIPLEIEEQLHKTFRQESTFQSDSKNPIFEQETATKNGSSEADVPLLTEITSRGERKGSVPLQLECEMTLNAENYTNLHSDSWKRDSRTVLNPTSGGEEKSEYSETMPEIEELECLATEETQTLPVDYQDAGTGTDRDNERDIKKQKMMDLVMAINNGIDIIPDERQKKSVRIKGIMKTNRTETASSLRSSGSSNSLAEEEIRRRAIQERKPRQTYALIGADYGFPSDISISGLFGDLVPMKWACSPESKVGALEENVCADVKSTVSEGGEGNNLIDKAFNILNAGLNLASSLIGDEAELEPREDTVHYNGYRVKVFGRRLLLESVHVNCDFNIASNGIHRNRSHNSLKTLTQSRESLEQSVDGRRVRIVVRLTGRPSSHKIGEANSIMEVDHFVQFADGKWTLIFGKGESRDNFVEICCPSGVHPESILYGLANGLLIADAP